MLRVTFAVYSHGTQQSCVLGTEKRNGKEEVIYISNVELIRRIKATGIDIALIHLGFCQSLPKPTSKDIIAFKEAAGDTPFSGYNTAKTYFAESGGLEVQFFDRIIIGGLSAEEAFKEMISIHYKEKYVASIGLWCYEK